LEGEEEVRKKVRKVRKKEPKKATRLSQKDWLLETTRLLSIVY
jgi:hypothetical protein